MGTVTQGDEWCNRQTVRLKTRRLASWNHHAGLLIPESSVFLFLYMSRVYHSAILAAVWKEMFHHEHQI